jgi:hypothetical protein
VQFGANTPPSPDPNRIIDPEELADFTLNLGASWVLDEEDEQPPPTPVSSDGQPVKYWTARDVIRHLFQDKKRGLVYVELARGYPNYRTAHAYDPTRQVIQLEPDVENRLRKSHFELIKAGTRVFVRDISNHKKPGVALYYLTGKMLMPQPINLRTPADVHTGQPIDFRDDIKPEDYETDEYHQRPVQRVENGDWLYLAGKFYPIQGIPQKRSMKQRVIELFAKPSPEDREEQLQSLVTFLQKAEAGPQPNDPRFAETRIQARLFLEKDYQTFLRKQLVNVYGYSRKNANYLIRTFIPKCRAFVESA